MLADIGVLQVFGRSESAEESPVKAREFKPDMVLMGVKSHWPDGSSAATSFFRSYQYIKVLGVTVYEEYQFTTGFLQVGSVGHLVNESVLAEMAQAIRLVFARLRHIRSGVAQRLAIKSFKIVSYSPFYALADRAIQATLMIVGCHKVQMISDKLCLSTTTVKTYSHCIFKRLAVSSDIELPSNTARHGMVRGQVLT